jgi:hypothetical protein
MSWVQRVARYLPIGRRAGEQTRALGPVTLPDLTLYDLTNPRGLGEWKSTEDAQAGGRSKCSLSFVEKGACNRQPDKVDGEGFGRFEGKLSGIKGGKMIRAGFCACRSPHSRSPIILHDYEGIVMKLRSDGRRYALNLKAKSFFSDFMGGLYQAPLELPAGEWLTVTVPFDTLILTSRGLVHEDQAELDRAEIHSIGFSILKSEQQESDGALAPAESIPFGLDIQWIKARQHVVGSRLHEERVAAGLATADDAINQQQ